MYAKRGTRIRYGAIIENEKLVTTNFENVPVYTSRISPKSLFKLLEALSSKDTDKSENNDGIMIDVFEKLLNSLEAQNNELDSDNMEYKKHINTAKSSFEIMREIIEKKKEIKD